MIDQPTLFSTARAKPAARRSDPRPAHAAAQAATKMAGSTELAILAWLVEHGPHRAADIAAAMPHRNDGTVRTACSRLSKHDLERGHQPELDIAGTTTVDGRPELVYAANLLGRRRLSAAGIAVNVPTGQGRI